MICSRCICLLLFLAIFPFRTDPDFDILLHDYLLSPDITANGFNQVFIYRIYPAAAVGN